jgi:hypothetical protein
VKKTTKLRKVLVILSNRFNRNQKHKFFEVEADEKGTILKEKSVRSQPRTPVYDEVWENDEGKTDMASCNRFRRKYPHPLEKPRAKT